MEEYNHIEIEKKWQRTWDRFKMFTAEDKSEKPKYYALIEFPYPSGIGMHVGHVRAYASLEVISRKRRMEGYNVLFPIGFDAFGLPTENYAIKTGIHPRIVTDNNIKTFVKQLKRAGFSFDFKRTVDTSNSSYYKWTQWIFARLFEKGLAYRSKAFVNYCPLCRVILSNEESQGGHCDRCDSQVVQQQKDVWFLKISEYAEKLLQGLEEVDYSSRIKIEQENWIGKSEGAEISFKVTNSDASLMVYTTRPDTVFGSTFLVIAPEHPLINSNKEKIINLDEVNQYLEQTKRKTEFERVHMNKEKTGVRIQGLTGINPLTNKEIPIYIADYVITGYGTGAIMAVPGHDTRDYDFAKKYNLEIIEVIQGGDLSKEAYTTISDGILVNSDFLNGLTVAKAQETILAYLEEKGFGKKKTQYKMQDWAFNRQRYWGEPIPIIHCPDCGDVVVPDNQLPIRLPEVSSFEPSRNGESPLSKIESFVNCKCPKCGKDAKRETDTMPQWAGSSWYFLRYCDPANKKVLADFDKLQYWMPVDWYNGGMEHVTRHMIYARFWNAFLYDIGITPYKEPFKKRTAQGLILGSDGEKMAKSKNNGVDPINIIDLYGADTLRTYLLFIGDYEQPCPWNDNAVKGVKRFLDKVWKLSERVNKDIKGYTMLFEHIIHKTIKEVSNDIESNKFNTAISKLMILTNTFIESPIIGIDEMNVLIRLLNPFAPHICEEINERLGSIKPLVFTPWPTYDEKKTIADITTMVVQINGKTRATFEIDRQASRKEIEEAALAIPKVATMLEGQNVVKIIIVLGKLINIVVA